MTMIDKDKEKSQPAVSNDTGTRRNEPASPRPKTNEGIDVMHVPSYLSSPVKTIVASTALTSQIPMHDLLDAYHILAIRLKTLVAAVPESISVSTQPALEYLRANSACILQALSRDIRRALANPFPSATQSALSDELVPEWPASTTHTPSHAQGAQFKTNEVNDILGSVILCHYALRLVCIIFRFEGLYQYFEAQDIHSAFFSVLALLPQSQAEVSMLPTPNSQKTRAMAVWVVQSQRLPSAIINSDRIHYEMCACIVTVLTHIGSVSEVAFRDALKAFSSMLAASPACLRKLHVALPNILMCVVSQSLDMRRASTTALAALAIAHHILLERVAESKTCEACALHVRAFVTAQCTTSARTSSGTLLPAVLSSALANQTPGSDAGESSAQWALHTLCALLVLSTSRQHSLYLDRRSLKLFVPFIGQAVNCERKDVRSWGEDGWKGLVWAFGRLRGSLASGRQNREDNGRDVECSAFRVVKQELGGGIGNALVSTLLAEESEAGADRSHGREQAASAVQMALEVVGNMIASERRSIWEEGVELLTRLLSCVGSSNPPTRPASRSASPSIDQAAIHMVLAGKFRCADPRHLTEHEIGESWDVLAATWTKAAERCLQGYSTESKAKVRNVIIGHLIRVWQSLLLIQAQLTQGHGHLTTDGDFTDRVISIVSDFLKQKDDTPCAESQSARLTFVLKLWRVMANVFVASWLLSPAARILAKMLGTKWALGNDGVSLEQLGRLDDMRVHSDVVVDACKHLPLDIDRQLWSLLAANWQEAPVDCEQAIKFLVVPFARWGMDAEELKHWDAVVGRTMSASADPHCVIEDILCLLYNQQSTSGSDTMDILPRRFHVPAAVQLPNSVLILLSAFLDKLYPPRPDTTSFCLELLGAIKNLILATPDTLLIPLLAALQASLNTWIVDELEQVPDQEYNEVIACLYSETLTKLSTLPPSVVLLQTLSPFLASGFSRVPAPAICPCAFGTFWKATFHAQPTFLHNLPSDLRDCLRAYDLAHSGDLAVGLSQNPESQSTFGSSVADSETSRLLTEVPIVGDDSRDNTPGVEGHALEHFGRALLSPSPIAFRRQRATSNEPSNPPPASHEKVSAVRAIPLSSQPFNHQKFSQEGTSNTPRLQRSQTSPCSVSLKRRNDRAGEVYSIVPRKRSKTDPKITSAFSISTQAKRTLPAIQQTRVLDSATLRQPGVTSEPISRVMSPIAQNRPPSEPAPRRKMMFDGVCVPTLRQLTASRHAAQTSFEVPLPRSRRNHMDDDMDQSSHDDIESWETELSLGELRSLRSAEVSDFPDTEMGDVSEEASSLLRLPFSDPPAVSPSVHRPVRRGHSQDASRTSPRVPPLRRARTTVEKLEAFKEAYKDVAGELSQMQGEELLQVVRLGHSAAATASEKLRPHLEKRS